MKAAPPSPRLLRVSDVAKSLRVGRDRVLSLIRRGEIRAVNVGDADRPALRIDAASLDEFLLRRTIPAVKPAPRRRRQTRRVEAFF